MRRWVIVAGAGSDMCKYICYVHIRSYVVGVILKVGQMLYHVRLREVDTPLNWLSIAEQ